MLSDPPQTAPRPSAFDSRLPATVVLLGVTSLLTDVGTEMIFPLLPVFLVEQLGSGAAYLGLVEGAADAVSSLLKLASGVAADAMPRRKPLVLFGYGLASAVRPFVAIATHPWHVLAVRVTDRVGKGIRGAPRDAMIADAARDRAGRAFGFHQAMDNVGAVVGPLLATLLVSLGWPLRGIFWLAIVPGILATTFVALVREPAVSRGDRAAPRATSRGATSAPLGRPLVLYLAILALFSLGNSSDAFLLLRARSVGLSTVEIPVLWSALNASKVFWAYVGGDWADRVSPARLIAGGWLVFAAVYLGLALASVTWHVWALFLLYGIFYGLTEPVEKALVKMLAPSHARGRAYGAYNFVVGATALPAGLLSGAIWNIGGGPLALAVSAAVAVAASALILVWSRTFPFASRPRAQVSS
ncbi:MAG: MFS transporter [Polyangiaceae bacterium]|nr:MFS transporter [Polyangiaceae bacterium]